jgi:hypothetical protein
MPIPLKLARIRQTDRLDRVSQNACRVRDRGRQNVAHSDKMDRLVINLFALSNEGFFIAKQALKHKEKISYLFSCHDKNR